MVLAFMSNDISAAFFLALGFWHLLCSFSSFIVSPPSFSARAWHPLPGIPPPLKYLELYLLLVLLPLSIGHDLVMATNFDPLVKGSTHTFRMASLLHLCLLLFFGLFVLTSILSQTTSLLPFPRQAPFLIAAAAFGFQWKILRFDAQLIHGLESECDLLLAGVAGICSLACGLLAWQPELFLADVALNMGILLQGFWRLQIGLSLHVDAFVPKGCHRLLEVSESVEGSTQCDLETDKLRAMTLMDFLFICYALMVILITVIAYGFAIKAHRRRGYFSLDGAPPQSERQERQLLQTESLPGSEL